MTPQPKETRQFVDLYRELQPAHQPTRDEIRAPGPLRGPRHRRAPDAPARAWCALSLILPHPVRRPPHRPHRDRRRDGAGRRRRAGSSASRVPPAAHPPAARPAPSLVTGVLIWESGLAVGQYGTIFIWATLISAYFFSRRIAAVHLAWLLLVYAGSLAAVDKHRRLPAGHPLDLQPPSSLTVVMLFVNNLVARRDRADTRARHFFDLSQDMLSHDGLARALHRGQRRLGAQPRLPAGRDARPAAARLHPPRRPRARDRGGDARSSPAASPTVSRRGVKAKDGSWHWLRTSSVFEPDEELVYARSTDVTERKALALEREALIAEIQQLARSDALTGLPNRRALDDRAAAARWRERCGPNRRSAWRSSTSTTSRPTTTPTATWPATPCCATAPPPGTRVARRRHDPALRRRGVPRRPARLRRRSTPTEIVERLRAATPERQTCSAGLAIWRPGESVDDLVGRADKALYEAKEAGRDRLVSAGPLA